MIRYVKPPFDPPPPNDLAAQLADAIRIAAADLAGRKETGLGHVIAGCDGYPIVTIGDGTTCHDSARASQGGALVLTADLGGSRATLQANLGRSQSPNSGYGGAGLSSGAIPPPLDAGAADISLSPVDQSLTVDILAGADAGGTGDPLLEFIGASISGKTGDSKRLAVCYGTNGAGIWDDILSGSETAITGLSINPEYILAQGSDKYALTKLYENTVSLVDAGAEASTTDLPAWTSGGPDFAFSAPALTRDGDTMAVLAPQDGSSRFAVYIGTSMLTAPSWATLSLGTLYDLQVYGTRGLVFDDNDVLYVAAYTAGTYIPTVLVIQPPYSSITTTITTSWTSSFSADQWHQPSPMALSRDGRYLACGAHGASGVLDIIKTDGRILYSTKTVGGYTLPDGTSNEQGYGGIAWGPDGRLFALLRKTADGSYHLAVWDGVSDGTPEIIDLSMPSRPLIYDWLSVAGDGQVVAVKGDATDEIILVEPPYTSAGATVTPKSLSYPITYQFEFDPGEAYQDATGLTLAVSVTSSTGSGDAVTVVTRFSYANTSGTAAFGVTIECPLPDGSTYVSSTDDGIYDAEAGLVRWLIPSVAASASGYVEMTTTTG